MSDPYRKVTVCDSCLQASCWQGAFYCDRYMESGTVDLPLWALETLALEAPSYWEENTPCPENH
jgi:hypothetical protein